MAFIQVIRNKVAKKTRLDTLLVDLKLAENIDAARKLIMSGQVLVGEEVHDKAGVQISPDSPIRILEGKEYVGRGALKLKSALGYFQISVEGKICADVGSSTGGFTEILLAAGANKVYAIDVGYNELDYKLRKDPRVVVMERTNARNVESLPDKIQLASIDVSFISLKIILPVVKDWLDNQGEIIALFKPQFEAEAKDVGEGGIITDASLHEKLLLEIIEWSRQNRFEVMGHCQSAILGAKGNKEFFLRLRSA